MAQITLCEGPPTFEGRANGDYLIIKFAASGNGVMLSRHDAIKLWQFMKAPIFEAFEDQPAEIVSFRRTKSDPQ